MPPGYRPLASPAAQTTTGAGFPVDVGASTEDVYVQIIITGTAACHIEASLDNANYVDVTDADVFPSGITSTTIIRLARNCVYYRVNVISISSGSVTAVWGAARGKNGLMECLSGISNTASGLALTMSSIANTTGYALSSTQIVPASPLTGGGALSANVPLGLTTSPAGQTPVGVTRSISTTSPLSGGGDLSANRTLTISAFDGTNAGIVPAGPNDATKYLDGTGNFTVPAGGGGGGGSIIRAYAYNGSAQSLVNNTPAQISFSAVVYDTDTMWSVGNPTRLTCNTAGVFLVMASVLFDTSATGTRSVTIYKNGAPFFSSVIQVPSSGSNCVVETTRPMVLAATDYLEVTAVQNSGGALNAKAGSSLSCLRIGDL